MRLFLRIALLVSIAAASSQTAGAAVSIVSAFMTTATATSTCAPGGSAVTSYASTASAAWLYLEVNGAAAGDVVSVNWINPSNQTAFTSTFQALTAAGEFCFSANLNIAGTSVASTPGNWSAQVVYNSSTLTTLPFSITGGSGGSCVYAVNPLTVSAPTAPATAAGGMGTITVSTVSGCVWTAASNSSFLTINPGSSTGSGNGTVSYTVAANTTNSSRTGTMTIAGQTVTITQAAGVSCAYAINPLTATAPSAPSTGSFTVSTTSTCSWTAVANSSFLGITSGGGATGSGTVNYSVANDSGAARSGTITVSGGGGTATFTLNQSSSTITPGQPFFVPGNANMWAAGQSSTSDGTVPPVYTLPAGSGQVITFSNVTGAASCSPQPGVCPAASGPDGVPGAAEANAMGSISGFIDRSAGYFLAGVFLTGSAPSGTAPESLDFTDSAFTRINPKIGQVFFIGDGLSGTGTGTQQQFYVPAGATRLFLGLTDAVGSTTYFYDDTGGFNVTLNISSGATPCTYSLTPNPITVPVAGGAESVTVNTQTGCFWSSTVNSSFITVNPNASSNGPGTFPFTVAAYTGSSSQTGTVLIADQTLSVVQSAGGVSGAQCNFGSGFASTTGMTLVGDAASATTSDGTVLRVTPATGNQSGAAYCTSQVQLGNNGTFSSQFQFRFTDPGGWDPADGITFVVATNTTGLGGLGEGIGYQGVGGNSFAIEFDTYDNGADDGNSSNHVAIDTNGNLSDTDLTNVYGNPSCGFPTTGTPPQNSNTVPGCMSNGDLWTVNINYDGSNLTVTLSDPAEGTRFTAINAYPVNLASLLGQSTAYVGFTSGTGAGWENHDIVNWTFSNTTSLGGPPPCSYTISAPTATVAAGGGSGSFNITASTSSCTWAAASNATWLHVIGTASGTGSATINYSADANTTGSARTGVITAGLQTFTVTQAAAVTCSFTLNSTSATLPAAGGTGSFTFTASASSCAWMAATTASFLTITPPTSGTGSGTVSFSAPANNGSSSLTGTITLGGQTFTVTQPVAACTYTVAPLTATVPAAGGTNLGPITVTTTSLCVWNVTSNASFLHPTQNSGLDSVNGPIGSGTVIYSMDANTSSTSRTGTLTIAAQTVTITQAAAAACTFTLNSTSGTLPAAGGTGSFTFTASASSCTWTAATTASFLTITPPTTGTGSGTVSFSAPANNTGSSLTGTITLGGQTFTVTQPVAPCTFTVAPLTANVPAAGGTNLGPITVTTTSSCVWNVTSNASFLHATQNSGLNSVNGPVGSGTVIYSVDANTSSTSRTGTLTIAGQTVTITQAGAAVTCSFMLTPATGTVPLAGGTGSFSVGASDPSCAWTASTTAPFLTITPPVSGRGNGTVNYTAAGNTSANSQTGTITVGVTGSPSTNATETITQLGTSSCVFGLTPTSQTAPAEGGSFLVAVSAPTGCTWTASSNNPNFITVTTGATGGNGDGTVTYTVSANSASVTRNGSLTIANVNFPVTQSAGAATCTFTLGSSSASPAAAGGVANVTLSASASTCSWTAASNVSWIMLTGAGSGTGSSTVSYAVAANSGAARSGTLTVAGQTFTVNQGAGAPVTCTFTLSPTSHVHAASGGTGSFMINASASSCAWTASTTSNFVTITSNANGTGTGSIGYSVAPDTGVERIGTITAGGQTYTVDEAGETAAVCTVTLPVTSATAPAAGGSNSVTVDTGSACTWNATSNASWITLNGAASGTASGTGNGNLSYTVAPNTGPAQTGTISISGVTFTVTQSAGASSCQFTLDPTSQAALPGGGPGQVLVIPSASNCAWTATSNNTTFINITSGATGTGPLVVDYTVTANTGSSARSGSLTIGSVNFPITQAAGTAAPCTFALNPGSVTALPVGGPGQVAVTTVTGCTWQAATTASWITIAQPGIGNGSGTVNFTVQPNTGASPQTGVITVGGQTFTVNQQAGTPAPCTYSLNPTSQSATVTGGAGSFAVTTATGCAWTATSNNTSFLMVLSGSGSGNGDGSVNYNVAQNMGAGALTGTITVQGQTFTLTQPGTGTTATNPCTFTLNPTSESATAAGGPAQVAVITATGCSWEATSNNTDWITITTGANGAGSGTVNYTVQANNTGSARTGSMTIAGNQFPVTQPAAGATSASACPFSLNPSSQTALTAGGPGQFTVNTQTGCTWQPVSNATWISITGSGSQAGTGAVNYTVAPNTTAGALTGTITVGTVTFTITQPAGTGSGNCGNESINPTSQGAQPGGGTSQVSVTAPAGCSWTATSNTAWLTVTNGGSGAGNGTVTYSVAAYTGSASQTGTITIAGQTFTVTQSGAANAAPCTYSFNPPSQSVDGTGGPGQTIVNTNTGCSWTATSDSPWLTITTGATGNSTGLVTYAVAPYSSGPPQTGNITVNGVNFQVTQSSGSGQACTFTLTPPSEPATSAGGTGQVAVTVATGCIWNAVSNNPDFLTITAGGNGNGSETLSYSVAANTGAQRTGTIAIAAGATFSVTQDAGSANSGGANNNNCTYSLNPTSQSAVAAGGTSQFSVTAATGCSWTAVSNNTNFLTITSGGSGSGAGTVIYAVAPNTGASSLTGTISVGGQTFTVTQAGAASSGAVPTAAGLCSFTLNPASGSASSAAGSAQVQVSTSTGCPWSAVSNNPSWLTITDGASESGNGTVTYAFAANTGSAQNGSLTIGGVNFPVSQSGSGAGSPGANNANCNYTLNPTSQSAKVGGGTGQIAVTTTSGCSWTATSNSPWLSITGGASGNGPGTVEYGIQANSGASSQTGTLTVANTTFTVTEDGTATTNTGCNLSLSPQSQSAAASGGSGTVTVTGAVGCPWTATSSVSWISIVSGGSGNGPGTFTYNVQANSNNTSQTGAVTVGGATFTVTQAASGGPSSAGVASLVSNCNYSIDPSAQSANAAGGSGSVAVSTTLGCSWTATSNVAWLVVTAGGTGSGAGSVTYSVSPNSGATQTGTLTVAGQTLTVTQAGTSGSGSSASGGAACNYSVNPASQSAAAAGGSDTVSVLAPVGCVWSATSSANWISITSGASGSGSGTVTYSAGANTTGASQSGTLTVAGQTVNITQGAPGSAGSGCTYSLPFTSQQATADGGTGQVAVAAGAGCAWTASTSSGSITITSGGAGSGNGTVSYTVSANTGSSSQTGTLTIAGQTLTITQAAAGASGDACTYTLNPSSISDPGTGDTGQVLVTAPLGCSWLATSSANWLTVIDSGTGQGNGVVTYGAAVNTTGAPQTGTITIGGQTLTISQAAPSAGSGPTISVGGVVNAASFAPPNSAAGAIAQGSFFSIFGSNMGPAAGAQVTSFPLGSSLAGVSIQISQGSTQLAAIPQYVSAGQINAILPSNTPLGTVQITVTYQGAVSNAVSFQVAANNWGTFSNPAGGTGPGIIQNVVTATQYDLNTGADSAQPGQLEIIWGTGLGAINGPDNLPPPVGNLATPSSITVGGIPAAIIYSGRTPCCSAVDNIYFTVPANAPLSCTVPVQVILNGSNMSNTVTMAISKNGGQCSN